MRNLFNTTGIGILILLFGISCLNQKTLTRKNIYEDSVDLVSAVTKVISEITPEDFKDIYDAENKNTFIVDVRSWGEYDSGFIPGAVSIPRGILEFVITDEDLWDESGKPVPQKNSFILLYCSSGNRSALAAKSLMELGYSNVNSLKGGWNSWNDAYPELTATNK